MQLNQQFLRNLLIFVLAFVIGKKIINGWESYKKKRAAVRIEHRAKQVDIEKREKQAIQVMHALIDSAQASLVQLQRYADQQPEPIQADLYVQINDLSQELYDIKDKFHRKPSPGLFLLGPLAAPAQVVKERVLKKRLLELEQKINKLIG